MQAPPLPERGDLAGEARFLESLASGYVLAESPQTQKMRELVVRAVAPHVAGGARALELGCSDGFMTAQLAPLFGRLDVIEGSPHFAERTRARRIPNVDVIVSLFESFRPEPVYDCVLAVSILEHVADPTDVYRLARAALKPGGSFVAVVPNAHAFSRQLAVAMGVLPDVRHLTPNDLKHGHRRTYDRLSLDRELAAAGFAVYAKSGVMFKILADFQLDKLIADGTLGAPQIEGLYQMGHNHPEMAGNIYSICRLA